MNTRVSESALDYALTHVMARSDTDIVPAAFEFNAIFNDWERVRAELMKVDLSNLQVRPDRTCLAPKRGLGFRIATQLDPLDTLMLTATVYEIGSELENTRIPVEQEIVHSHRFAPEANGQLYRSDIGFSTFRRRSLELAAERGGMVLLTDIADFFPRVYHHPLENALAAATANSAQAKSVYRMLRDLNQRKSHGVPVGPSVVRLLVEVTIDDIDRALQSEGYTFCRYSDDYRIFVADEGEARRACAFLAKTLFLHHGLTIQESKTEIVDADSFIDRFSRTEDDAVRESLSQRFDELVEQLRRDEASELPSGESEFLDVPNYLLLSDYLDFTYEDLDDDQKAMVDSLNLWELVRQQINADGAIDVSFTRFLLHRIADLRLKGDHEMLFDNLDRLYPMFPQVVAAIAVSAHDDESLKEKIGGRLLDLFQDPIVGHLEYHRAWILSLFAADAAWNHSDRLIQMYGTYFDSFTRTEIVHALGRAKVAHWFRSRKQEVARMEPWERRAFLAGARCLPRDEAEHWYRSIRTQVDDLDRIVVDWARSTI